MSYLFFPGTDHDIAVISHADNAITIALANDQPARKKPKRAALISASAEPGTTPSVSQPTLATLLSVSGEVMPWGEGNDFPQRIIELYQKDPIIPQTLGKLAAMLQGRGVIAVEETLDDAGKEIARPIRDAAINQFLSSHHFTKYIREAASDVVWFFNTWPELIISRDRSQVAQIHNLNAEEVRWCMMTDTGQLPHVWLNANWPYTGTTDAQTKKIIALDPYRFDRSYWVRNQAAYNIVYPVSYPTPGKRFYALAHHYSIVESGWLDVHLAVPAFKKYLMKNQMTVKYHWKVDQAYWPQSYPGWDKKTGDERRTIKAAWLKTMSDSLTNVEKTGSSIMTDTFFDKVNNRQIEYISVTAVTDSMIDGKYVEDNLEAAANIFYALGVDPTIVGFAGGSKQGARSGGSDKREAYLIALQMMMPMRDMILEPLEFIAEYNGWKKRHPNLRFRFRDTILTTLDTGAGTAKKLS